MAERVMRNDGPPRDIDGVVSQKMGIMKQRNKLEESLREEKVNPPSVPRLEGSRTPIEKIGEKEKGR